MKVTTNDGKPKYKARLVVKEIKQQQGVKFEEIFSLVAKMITLHCVLALNAREDMELVHIDVKIVFLHGDLHEDIYMQQLEGFIIKSRENLMHKLKNILYGLKQA